MRRRAQTPGPSSQPDRLRSVKITSDLVVVVGGIQPGTLLLFVSLDSTGFVSLESSSSKSLAKGAREAFKYRDKTFINIISISIKIIVCKAYLAAIFSYREKTGHPSLEYNDDNTNLYSHVGNNIFRIPVIILQYCIVLNNDKYYIII